MMTHSKYLQLAIRIDADISGGWFLCKHLDDKTIVDLFVPDFYYYDAYLRDYHEFGWWVGYNIEGNQQRIIALLFMNEMYLDEQRNKKKL